MLERLLQKIAEVREQPEHIRMRWALGSVLVCMVFIIGIWFLTLKQGFLGASTEARAGISTVKDLSKDVQKTDTSLKDLLKSDKTLSVDQKTLTGDEFLQKELEKKQTTPTTTIPNQPQE